MSFYHNVFAREHNLFVDAFRAQAARDARRRLRPAQSRAARPRSSATATSRADELFEVARLVVAAEIAKIHTIEWTHAAALRRAALPRHERQLDGPVRGTTGVVQARAREGRRAARASPTTARRPTAWYSVFASGPGHLRARQPRERRRSIADDLWNLPTRTTSTAAINHFGSPFNFPGGVRHGLPAAPAGAGPDRVPRAATGPQRDPEQDPGRRDLPRQGDRAHARARAGELGPVSMGRQRLGAAHAAEPPAVPAEPRRWAALQSADRARSTWRRSTSSGTASAACRASTSSAGSTGCGS